jgi:plastocyanin
MKIFGPKESKDEKEELKNETKEEKKQEQEQKKDETQEKVEDKKEEKTDDSPEVNETSSNDQEEGDDNSNQKETEVESETEVEVEVEEEFEGETHTVLLENKGFNPSSLTIKVGDKVKWKVSRTGNFKNGMILGTQNCVGVKSKILNNGEEFEWEFKKAETCTFVDGIITTQVSKVIVEE